MGLRSGRTKANSTWSLRCGGRSDTPGGRTAGGCSAIPAGSVQTEEPLDNCPPAANGSHFPHQRPLKSLAGPQPPRPCCSGLPGDPNAGEWSYRNKDEKTVWDTPKQGNQFYSCVVRSPGLPLSTCRHWSKVMSVTPGTTPTNHKTTHGQAGLQGSWVLTAFRKGASTPWFCPLSLEVQWGL